MTTEQPQTLLNCAAAYAFARNAYVAVLADPDATLMAKMQAADNVQTAAEAVSAAGGGIEPDVTIELIGAPAFWAVQSWVRS